MGFGRARGMLFAALLAVAVAGAATTASADGRWDQQVTGEILGASGGVQFTLAVSARTAGEDDTQGQVQYTREGQSIPDLSVHGTIECFYVQGGHIAIAGPAHVQDDPGGQWNSDWVSVEIRADGGAVRFRGVPADATNCGYSGSTPGTVIDGSFDIEL